jgi:alkylation response protein AidB-like acyl-CoA dehydrogenase
VDFDDTPEEAAFRTAARAWLDEHAIPKGAPDDFSAGFFTPGVEPADYVKRCREWQHTLHEHGWAGIAWPKAFGGRGGRPIEAAIFAQEQAHYGVSVGAFAVAHGMVAPTLMAHGRPDQQHRYLAPMLRGEEVWCQLFSEPGAGSDLASLATRAEADGDELVVTGQKVWTSGAHYSEWGILLARTSPPAEASKHAGITYLVVDMASPGIDIRPLRQINGEAHFNEVFLDEVRVPRHNVVGEIDNGWRVAVTTLTNERVAIAGGSAASDPVRLLQLAAETGARDDPVVRQQLAVVHTRNEILRFLRYRMLTALSRGTAHGPEGSVMKLLYSRFVKDLTELGLEMEGAGGMLDHPHAPHDAMWQYKFLNSVQSSIGGGTDEVQRNIIGERVLGLPREPRPGS